MQRATDGDAEAQYGDSFSMRPDETLQQILTDSELWTRDRGDHCRHLRSRASSTRAKDVPWFPEDVDAWEVRWVLLHLIEELARHAGHADIFANTSTAARCTRSWRLPSNGRRRRGCSNGSRRGPGHARSNVSAQVRSGGNVSVGPWRRPGTAPRLRQTAQLVRAERLEANAVAGADAFTPSRVLADTTTCPPWPTAQIREAVLTSMPM